MERFQFTRPQGARRKAMTSISWMNRFNSRARKGRDRLHHHSPHREAVSIHAPARGATGCRIRGACPRPCFNSRAREGRDPTRRRRGPRRAAVSIHTPARGATYVYSVDVLSPLFQFTRPRGARRRFRAGATASKSFNSRAREGRDLDWRATGPKSAVSIHAPARGATREPHHRRRLLQVSIHAPARGATISSRIDSELTRVSIHAPARGATSSPTTPQR